MEKTKNARGMKNEPALNYCIECAWCGIKIDFDSDSHYFCAKSRKPLKEAVLFRRACADFSRPEAPGLPK